MKVEKKPAVGIFPVPTVLVTSLDKEGKPNVATLAWVGNLSSEPPIIGIGLRSNRYTYENIKITQEFAVNVPGTNLVAQVDKCGLISGRDANKFELANLTPVPGSKIKTPIISECPISMECRLKQIVPLGSHDLFVGEVVAVNVEKDLIDEKGKINIKASDIYAYISGEYWSIDKKIGHTGYSKKLERG